MNTILKIIIFSVLAIGLSGCFVSKHELITANNADFPFTTMTYTEGDGKNIITIKRVGDKYIVPAEKEKTYIRLKKINKDLYIGQMAATDDGKINFLFAIFNLSADRKNFTLSKAVAEVDDIIAAKNGQSGLSICDKDVVCISSLDGFAKYERQSPSKDDDISRFKILAIE